MKKLFAFIIALSIYHFTFNIDNCSGQWVQMSNGMGIDKIVNALISNGTNIFAGTNGSGVYLSTNNGTSWTQTALNDKTVSALAVSGNKLFAGISLGPINSDGVYLSTNNGTSWTLIGLAFQEVYSLAIIGDILFAGTPYGVYLSTINGGNWTPTSLHNKVISSLTTNGNTIFAGTPNSPSCSVYLYTINDTAWTQTALNDKVVWSLATLGNINIIAGTEYGVYRSAINGTIWTQSGLSNQTVYALAVSGSNIFAGTSAYPVGPAGVFLSTNSGSSWLNKNQGLQFYGVIIPDVTALLIANNYIFAGTVMNGSVWRRSYSEIIGVQNISSEIPGSFSLLQNYPNPFNPTTNIRYDLPKNSFVRLVVFDMLGKEKETLVDEKQSAGTYEATFDGSNYPSGVYFYRLTTDYYSETKRMTLVK